MSDPDLEAAPLHVARSGTRMVWRQLEGSKMERGIIGPMEPDLLAHYLWEGRPSSMYFFCIGCAGDDVEFDHAEYESLFPLEVGKSVTFPRTIEHWSWTNAIAVSGTERLRLDFGEVDTYVIVSETRGLNNPFHARNGTHRVSDGTFSSGIRTAAVNPTVGRRSSSSRPTSRSIDNVGP